MTATIPSVREWARANGYTVGDRGRLKPEIHAGYAAAHPEAAQGRERPQNGAHCPNCGRTWTALRECHCTICHRHFATVRWFDDHRKGMGRHECLDPATIPTSRNNPEPKYKIVVTAWGELVTLAVERPDSFVYMDGDSVCDECGAPTLRNGGIVHRRGCSEAPALF